MLRNMPTATKVAVDLKGKASGRGAYVCRDTACLKQALKSKALERNLDTSIPQEIYDALIAQMEVPDGTTE